MVTAGTAAPDSQREALVRWLLVAMTAWSVFAVGGVYDWAADPLVVAAILLVAIARPKPIASRETRMLDVVLVVAAIAVCVQLVPLPPALLALVSPHAGDVRSAIYVGPRDPEAWWPISVSPNSTAHALAMVLTALVVFQVTSEACERGSCIRIVRHTAFVGLFASLTAIALSAGTTPSLIYGLWEPLDAGARPFGPFVNRNHFATWVLMAGPLAAGYVATAIDVRRSSRIVGSKLAAWFETLGTSTAWVGAAGVVMILALLISTSRSGLIGLCSSLVGGAWLSRDRRTRPTRVLGVIVLVALAVAVLAYVNVQPLLSRVEETITVGAGGRSRIWQETLRLIGDFWLTGTGLGAYQTAMLVYQTTGRSILINQAHNQYLQLLAEGGVLLTGLAILTVIVFTRLFSQRLGQDASSAVWLRIGGGSALLAVAVQSIWETGLRMPANGLLFAIAAAVAMHRPTGSRAGR